MTTLTIRTKMLGTFTSQDRVRPERFYGETPHISFIDSFILHFSRSIVTRCHGQMTIGVRT
jgi:hypothetical protein